MTTQPPTPGERRILEITATSAPHREFRAQVDLLGTVATFDADDRSWHASAGTLDDRTLTILNTVLKAARRFGTTVHIELVPAPGTWTGPAFSTEAETADEVTDHENEDGLDDDVLLLYSYALNLPLDDNEPSSARWQDRLHAFAHDVVDALDADPARLARAAAGCRNEEQHAQEHPDTDDPQPYTWAAQIADTALEILRQADVHDAEAGRGYLAARDEQHDKERQRTRYRQGPLHRHSPARRLLRRANPAWWLRRRRARASVTMTTDFLGSDRSATAWRHLRIVHDHDGDIGDLNYRICQACCTGLVGKLELRGDHQGVGLGSAALAAVRNEPGAHARWHTSGQYDTAKSFWRGHRMPQGTPCDHLK